MRRFLSVLFALSLVCSLMAPTASAAEPEETGMAAFSIGDLAALDAETASPEMKDAIMLARRLIEMDGGWTASSGAAGPDGGTSGYSLGDLASLDTKTASPELKNAIMLARRLIVYGGQGWTVGGAASVLHADGSVEKLPEFSDLWPDWDLYEVCVLSPDPMYYTDTFWAGRTGGDGYPVKLHVLTEKERAGFDSEWEYYAHTVSTAYLGKSNAAGTNGGVCAPFTANRTSAAFLLTSAPGAADYNVQLYRGVPGEGERVSDHTKVTVDNGVYLLGLTVGESYYFKISSNTLSTAGCTAKYSLFY